MKPETLSEALNRTERNVEVSFWLLQGAIALYIFGGSALVVYALWEGGFLDG